MVLFSKYLEPLFSDSLVYCKGFPARIIDIKLADNRRWANVHVAPLYYQQYYQQAYLVELSFRFRRDYTDYT